MTVSLEKDAGARACVVRLSGDVDSAVVPEIRSALDAMIDTGCEHVVLDLERVTYVDSTALGLIVWLDRKLAPSDGRVILAGAGNDVARILELSGLVGVAPTVSARENVDDALSGLEHVADSDTLSWSESILLPAQVESLAEVRGAVCDLLAAVDLSESSLFDVKVAVGEALANAVRHGSPGGENDQVRIDLSAYDDRIVIEVRDHGAGLEGEPPESTIGDDLFASGGRGVLFMKALMDRVEFARDESTGGTIVTLIKRLPVRRDREA